MKEFNCSICKQTKPKPDTAGTGYGYNDKHEKICYQCCGDQDKQAMLDMAPGDKNYMYLSLDNDNAWHSGLSQNWNNNGANVSNWPGTFKINIGVVKRGRHNIAGRRYDFWFRFHGSNFHGVQYGDNTQIAHIQKLKH